jgi:hypothetical protein
MPKGGHSPEGRAATLAGHAAWYAMRRAAKSRGEAVPPTGGRKKHWPIPRPWRLAPDADEAVVMTQRLDLAARVSARPERPPWVRGGGNETTDALERMERQWIAKVNDAHCRELPDALEAGFDRIMEYESVLGPHGRDARVTRLRWEREHWIIRRATAETLDRMAREAAAERSDPGQWSAPSPPVELARTAMDERDEDVADGEDAAPLASCPPYEDPPPVTPAPIDPYAMADAITSAGQTSGQRRRGSGSSGFRWTKG